MGNLKVYGVAGSRAYRVLWMVNELGLDYEHVPIHFGDGSAQAPQYLAVNPNGRIPAIDDNGLKLWESMAINLYLAKKHSELWPSTLEGEAQALQWSFWAMTEVEKPALAALLHRMFLPEEKRDPKLADRASSSCRSRSKCSIRRSRRPAIWWARASRSPISMSPRCCPGRVSRASISLRSRTSSHGSRRPCKAAPKRPS
jgi:hypothetical protein